MSSPTPPSQKRCYYEVLNLPQTCTQDEIRSSYKKLALQRHPDKLIQSGVSSATATATASFQELRHAYEVLSDPKERSWYDSHRSQILFSSPDAVVSGAGGAGVFCIPDLFPFFSGACYSGFTGEGGFYNVYGEVFGRVYGNEVVYCRRLGLGLGLVKEAPLIGDLGSDYGQVTAFYGYWLGFGTVMDFGWVSKWDAGAGVDRKSRRVMEEENKKVRKKARKEYNESVRELAEFVKKRDKRVIDMVKRREVERERKREEEVRKRKEVERAKVERARNYVEPDWAKVGEDLIGEGEDEEEEDGEGEKKRELYCAACGKKFKSDKQWKNHEQSRKHKDKVAELRRFFKEEDVEFVDDGDEGESKVDDVDDEEKDDGFVSAEDEKDEEDELHEKFKECVGIDEGVENLVVEEEVNGKKDDGVEKVEEELNGVVGKKVTFEEESNSVHREGVVEEVEVAEEENDNKKGKKKSRRAKKEKGKANDDNSKPDVGSSNGGSDGDDDEFENRRGKGGKKGGDRKSKRDVESLPKNSSKGRKHREKDPNPACEKCGEEFDSRNQLYKHLTETGHASLKLK